MRVSGRTIAEVSELPLEDLAPWLDRLELTEMEELLLAGHLELQLDRWNSQHRFEFQLYRSRTLGRIGEIRPVPVVCPSYGALQNLGQVLGLEELLVKTHDFLSQ